MTTNNTNGMQNMMGHAAETHGIAHAQYTFQQHRDYDIVAIDYHWWELSVIPSVALIGLILVFINHCGW